MRLLLDMGGTDVKAAISEDGRIVRTQSFPTAELSGSFDNLPSLLAPLLEGLGDLAAVGMALPGVVDPNTGELLHANDKYSYAQGFDLREWGQTAFGAPTAVENDARAALIGEVAQYEKETGSVLKDAVLVTLGTGIGTAAMLDGVAVGGSRGHAGNLGGHVTLDFYGDICPCGNRGCAETVASTWALTHGDPRREGYAQLVAEVKTGDAEAIKVLDHSTQAWGATIVAMCHMFDPEVVFVTGGVLRAGDLITEPVFEYVDKHLWPSVTTPTFVIPDAPELSVVRGLDVIASGVQAR